MNKDELVQILKKSNYLMDADAIENGADAICVLMRLRGHAQSPETKRAMKAICEFVAFANNQPSFWMVFREGGRAPAFKHSTEASAVAEAKRIARESGEAVHVLVAVAKIEPNAMPSPEEFARHANANPYGPAANAYGLWRVCVDGKLPAVLAVRCGQGGPYASFDSPGGSCLPAGAKWFPLDANGKDVSDDSDIPF